MIDNKKTKKQLIEELERYRTLFDNAPLGYQSLNESGNFVEVNEAWCKTLGYERNEVIGRNFSEFIHPDFREHFKENFPKFKSMGYILGVEFEMIKKDGSEIIVSFNGRIGHNDDGTFKQTHCLLNDITDRKQAEEGLRESEEKFRALSECSSTAIYQTDRNGDYIYVNPKWLEMAGMSSADALGKGWKKALHPEDRNSISDNWYRSVQSGGKWGYEYRFLTHDKQTIHIFGTAAAIRNSMGEVIGYVGSNVDITERKSAENALRESEEIFSKAFQSNITLMAISTLDDGKFIEVNHMFLSVLGYDRKEVIGKTSAELNLWENLDHRDGIIRSMQEKGSVQNVDVDIMTKSGEIRGGLFSVHPIELQGRQCLLTIMNDITERKRAEEALKESEKKLSSHLRNTPIVAIEWNLNFEVAEWNMAAEKVFGYTKDEAMGRHAVGLIVPESAREHVDQVWNDLLVNEGGFHSTNENFTKDGRIIMCDWNNTPLVDESGKVYGVASLVQDITDRKQAEEALRRYECIVTSSTDMLALLDKNFVYLAANEKYLEPFGLTRDNLIGLSVAVVFGSTFFETVIRPNAEKCLQGNRVRYIETFDFPTGGKRDMEITYDPYLDPDNKIVGFVVNGRDITERLRAENALRESEQKYRNIFDNTADLYHRADMNGKLVLVNPSGVSICGYDSADEMIGHDLKSIYKNPEDRLELLDKLKKYGKVENYEVHLKRKNGTTIIVETNTHFIFDELGKPIGVEGYSRDITERKLAAEEILRNKILLESCIESSKDMIILSLDKEYRYLNFNKTHAESMNSVFGSQPQIGECIFDYMEGKDDVAKAKSHYDRAMAGEGHSAIEEYGSDHLRFYYEIQYNPIFNEKNEIIGVTCFSQNITERLQGEEKIRLQSEIIKNMAEGVYLIGADDGLIRYCNPAFERIFGYSSGEMIGKHASIVNAPAGKAAEEIANEIMAILDETGEWHGEINNIKKDGTSFWCQTSCSIFQHPEFGRVIVAVHADITNRKLAEVKLRVSEKRYSDIVDSMLGAVYQFMRNKHGQFSMPYMSDAIERIVGVKPDVLIQDANKMFEYIHPDDHKGFLYSIEQSAQSMSLWEFEFRVITPEKKIKWLKGSSNPSLTAEGEILWNGVLMDITERKKAEKALERRLNVERLMGDISFDLANLPFDKVDMGIDSALEKMARFAGANRSSLFINTEDLQTITNTHEWCESPKDSQKERLQNIPFKLFGYHTKQLIGLEIIKISKLDDYPPEAMAEKKWAAEHGFRSLVFVPLALRGRLHGALGLYGEIGKEIVWPEDLLDLLRNIGNTLVNFLERKQVEQSIKDSERKSSAWLENSPVCTKVLDLDFNLQYISTAGVEALKIDDVTSLYGKPYPFDFYPDSFKNQMRENLEKAKESGKTIVQEASVVDIDGNELWFHSTIVPVRDANGRVDYMMVLSFETTERKRATNLLLMQHDLVQKLGSTFGLDETLRVCQDTAIEMSGMDSGGIYIFDEISGTLRLITSKGLSPEFIEASSTYELCSPSFSIVMAGDAVYVKHEELIDSGDEVKKREGLHAIAVVPILYKNQVIACMNIASHTIDEIPAYVRTVLVTIAGQIGSFIARAQAEEKLRKSEEKFKEIIIKSPIPMVIVDSNQDIELFNDKFIEVFGYTKEDITNADDWLKTCYPDPDYRAKIRQGWEQATNVARELKTEIAMPEWKLTCKNSGVKDVEFKHMPLGDISLIVLNDITETRRLQELESRAERLEMAGTIAGQVAHDFNNLLGPLMAYPDFIRDELPRNHPTLKYIDQIEQASIKIADINQDLLAMGRRGHYNQDVLNLNSVVLQAVSDIEPHPKALACEIDLSDDLMDILAGGAQLHRMISNLLNNAKDAMQNIGTLTVKTENYYVDEVSLVYGRVPKGEYVKLTISDTGCGIPDNIVQKIFDPFFTSKTTDKKRGSGLGMSVVDAVIKDHNGYIDLETKVGAGTSFYIYFPITRKSIDVQDLVESSGGRESILIIDDDDIQREVSYLVLKKLGYEVCSVESGEKAVELLRESPKDILILDMVMPLGIDGAETYKRILKFSPEQKAIIVSGFSESERVIEVQKLGAGAFIKKPITRKEIAAAVRTELDRKAKLAPS